MFKMSLICRTKQFCSNHRLPLFSYSQYKRQIKGAKGIRSVNSRKALPTKIKHSSSFLKYDSHSRFLASQTTQPKVTSSVHPEYGKFTGVYKLPSLIILRAISRLKLFQTGLMVTVAPASYYLYQAGQMSYQNCIWIVEATGLACLMLYLSSFYIRRVICILSLNEAQDKVKLSHLSFWGKRKDKYLDLEDFKPFSDISEDTRNTILHVKLYTNPKDKYYLFLGKYGMILDREKFERIFGKLN